MKVHSMWIFNLLTKYATFSASYQGSKMWMKKKRKDIYGWREGKWFEKLAVDVLVSKSNGNKMGWVGSVTVVSGACEITCKIFQDGKMKCIWKATKKIAVFL